MKPIVHCFTSKCQGPFTIMYRISSSGSSLSRAFNLFLSSTSTVQGGEHHRRRNKCFTKFYHLPIHSKNINIEIAGGTVHVGMYM
jgi:hypothetical protein